MKKIIILTTAALTLAACSDGSQISESALKKGIEDFAFRQNVCIAMPLTILDTSGQPLRNTLIGEPRLTITNRNNEGKRINKEVIEQMDILVNAGIYREADKKSVEQNDMLVKTVTYELTENGIASLRHGSQGPLVCVGNLKVSKINWFTEPTPTNGMTVSKVSYQADLIPEKWAKKLIKTNNGDWKNLSEPQEYTATMVKTNKGWQDLRQLH
ncbi:lipoprotein [Neisseria sp. 83E34]|uniref:lipoprotein n=1 Tax=Neisseria sp. 83E34 TaxID=1692264 RepID=UPI0006CE6873|nr:lipoprotein [Neisseria sp. 83E34]KPN70879.1 hypothetical protein AKG09_09420 [Neisseria sp. 83E34]